MITGINLSETREWTWDKDPEPDNPTIFHIGVLDSVCYMHIEKQTSRMSLSGGKGDEQANVSFSQTEKDLLTVKLGLKGVDNFLDPRQSPPVPIQFRTVSMPIGGRNYETVSNEILRMFDKDLLADLAKAIRKENNMSEEEEKN